MIFYEIQIKKTKSCCRLNVNNIICTEINIFHYEKKQKLFDFVQVCIFTTV